MKKKLTNKKQGEGRRGAGRNVISVGNGNSRGTVLTVENVVLLILVLAVIVVGASQ